MKICQWGKKNWKLLLVLLLSAINLVTVAPVYRGKECLSTLCLVFFTGLLMGLTGCIYIKEKEFPLIFLLGIAEIPVINFLFTDDVSFSNPCLCVRAILFLMIAGGIQVVLWLVKTRQGKKFIPYLLASLATVVIGFAGFYGSLYSMYLPYGQEPLKIDQGMSYAQAVMPIDFIYYSADTLFGTDISDVSLNYTDYMELHDQTSIVSQYTNKYKGALAVTQVAKACSMVESALFIVYISIIVLGAEKKENAGT